MTALVWFRKDLRLTDNPAWAAASRAHDRIQAVFILESNLWRASSSLRARQLAANLKSLDGGLAARGGKLLIANGPASSVMPSLARDYDAVYWNADYSPFSIERDRRVRKDSPVPAIVTHGSLIHPPGTVTTGSGDPYRVFTPFWKRWRAIPWEPWPTERSTKVGGKTGDGLPEAPGPPPYVPGEEGAAARLLDFLEMADRYAGDRDRLDADGTSRLSIDLKFGTISPRMVADEVGDRTEGRAAFVRQLAWREFHTHSLSAFPDGYTRPLQRRYDAVVWSRDRKGLAAWKAGSTGYPIVDAGMRQLRAEGWMHNRARLITASFLVKDLLIDWRLGERHFRRLLVDADPAQNVGNWQWVASTGFDAAPYFRIMNPVAQSARYDPDGTYIRRWVPELARVPTEAIHDPWEHRDVLDAAGVRLGADYPFPLVDHREAREQALAAFGAARA